MAAAIFHSFSSDQAGPSKVTPKGRATDGWPVASKCCARAATAPAQPPGISVTALPSLKPYMQICLAGGKEANEAYRASIPRGCRVLKLISGRADCRGTKVVHRPDKRHTGAPHGLDASARRSSNAASTQGTSEHRPWRPETRVGLAIAINLAATAACAPQATQNLLLRLLLLLLLTAGPT